jgi:hypothetical protein
LTAGLRQVSGEKRARENHDGDDRQYPKSSRGRAPGLSMAFMASIQMLRVQLALEFLYLREQSLFGSVIDGRLHGSLLVSPGLSHADK